MAELLQYRLIQLLYYIAIALLVLLVVLRLFPYFLHSLQERNNGGIVIAALSIAITAYAIWYLGWPMVPESQKSTRREETHWSYWRICRDSPKYTECRPISSCKPCESRFGCYDAVRKYADSCFNNLYSQFGKITPNDFDVLMNNCINDQAGCVYFEGT